MKHNILLCVVGNTPQIITETIYGLASKRPRVHINELIVVTTSSGAKRIKESLIDKGILNQLISDCNLPEIKFPLHNIHIIKSPEGEELSDIRTTLDNEVAGDFICRIVRELTQNSNSILHCSIAGGRKTMGFYLGTALQLYGRRDDRLYHVLVNEEFENHPDFFYPPPRPHVITLRDGKTISTDKAKIELAELPFITLRKFIDFHNQSLKDLIDYTQMELDAIKRMPPLEFLLRSMELKIGNKKIKLSPSLWKFYIFFAEVKKIKCPQPHRSICKDCYDCFLPMKKDERSGGLCDVFKDRDEGQIRISISKVNKALEQQILSYEIDVTPYLIKPVGQPYRKRYGLSIDKSRINFLEE